MARRLRSPVGAAAKVRPAFNRVHASSKPTPAAISRSASRAASFTDPARQYACQRASPAALAGCPRSPAATRPSAATVNAAARPQRRNDDPLMATPVPAAADAGAAEPAYSDLPARSRQAPARPPVPPSSPRAQTLRRIAVALAAILGLWAAIAAATGGVTLDLGGLRLSSRAAWRPAAIALGLVALALWRTTADERRRLLDDAAAAADRHAPVAAALLAAVLLAVSAVLGAHVAGGADSSGYLSQSRLWAQGRITVAAPVLVDAPWPERGRFVAPLGYRASVRRRRARPHLRSGAALADGDRRRDRSATPAATSGRRSRRGCSCGPPTGSPPRRRRRRWRWPRR